MVFTKWAKLHLRVLVKDFMGMLGAVFCDLVGRFLVRFHLRLELLRIIIEAGVLSNHSVFGIA